MKLFGIILLLSSFVIVAFGEPADSKPPSGFELQILEPTGGSMFRPDGWHYAELHGGPRYKWIVSKEDPSLGPYKTGVMLQLFSGIKEGTGKTPKEFCEAFLESRSASAKTVHLNYPETDMGLFTRKGVMVSEVTEFKGKPVLYRVVYSVFWMSGDSIAAVMSAGCPEADWDTYSDTFDTMGQIKLIDMTRFPESLAE